MTEGAVIRIEVVHPNAHDLRPIKGGWGAIHWVCMVPTHAMLLGFVAYGVVSSIQSEGQHIYGLFSAFLVGAVVVTRLGQYWLQAVMTRECADAPTGGLDWTWSIDEKGLQFDTPLQSNRTDWRGVKAAREESDRFIFLVTPGYNPVLPKRQMTADQIAALKTLIADVTASGRLGRGVD